MIFKMFFSASHEQFLLQLFCLFYTNQSIKLKSCELKLRRFFSCYSASSEAPTHRGLGFCHISSCSKWDVLSL